MAAGTVCHQKHIRSAVDFAAALRNAVIGMKLFSLVGCAMGGVSIAKAVPDSHTITGSGDLWIRVVARAWSAMTWSRRESSQFRREEFPSATQSH